MLIQLGRQSEGGEGVLLIHQESQRGQSLGGQGRRGGIHDPQIEDGNGQGAQGEEEGVVQVDPPGRGGGVGQDCGGPSRQWGVWGGRWKSQPGHCHLILVFITQSLQPQMISFVKSLNFRAPR